MGGWRTKTSSVRIKAAGEMARPPCRRSGIVCCWQRRKSYPRKLSEDSLSVKWSIDLSPHQRAWPEGSISMKFQLLNNTHPHSTRAARHLLHLVTRYMWILVLITFWNAREGYSFYEFEHRYLGNAAFELAEAELYRTSQQTDQDPFFIDWKRVTRDVLAFEDSARYKTTVDNAANSTSLRSRATDFLSLIPLKFGDLAALAGDHAETPQDLLEKFNKILEGKSAPQFYALRQDQELKRSLAIRRQWLNACRWHYQSQHTLTTSHQQRTQDVCFGGEKDIAQFLNLTKLIQLERDKFGSEDDLRKFYHTSSKGYSRSRQELREFEGLANYVDLAADNKTHFPYV